MTEGGTIEAAVLGMSSGGGLTISAAKGKGDEEAIQSPLDIVTVREVTIDCDQKTGLVAESSFCTSKPVGFITIADKGTVFKLG